MISLVIKMSFQKFKLNRCEVEVRLDFMFNFVIFLLLLDPLNIMEFYNQEFALGFSLVYIHDKDWLCSC